MKLLPFGKGRNWRIAGLLLAGLSLAGCQSADPVNPPNPFSFPGQTAPPTAAAPTPPPPPPETTPPAAVPQGGAPTAVPAGAPTNSLTSALIRVGDLVTVDFSDLPTPLTEVRTRVGEDGKITLPFNISVQAVGRTPRQLEQEIRSAYVPRYYNYLTVTVKAEERFYYVGGEVKIPNRIVYAGEITVLRAIDSAGGFTDFAQRKKIELRRANGEKHMIDWSKAIKDPKLDLPVYPNDQITVHKKGPFG